MSSTGKGRLYGTSRYPTLRGRIAVTGIDAAARTVAGDTFWGGFPPAPTQIPYSWLTPPARWRSDQPRNVAQITRTSGATARSSSSSSVTAVGERPFSATLDTRVIDDPANFANWIVANYTSARQRMPQIRLNLSTRTPTECWRILEREIGDRISITGAPGSSRQLLSNPWMESGTSPWSGDGSTLASSSTWSRSGSQSTRVTPAGAGADARIVSESVAVVAGASYTIDGWLLSPGGWTVAAIQVWWFDNTGALVSTGSTAIGSLAAGASTRLTATVSAPAGAATARMFAVQGGGPAVTDVYLVDELSLTGPDGSRTPWPAGVTELVIEGVEHSVDGKGTRWVVWNTAPLIGASPGQAGPWFRAGDSTTDTGSGLLAF